MFFLRVGYSLKFKARKCQDRLNGVRNAIRIVIFEFRATGP